MAARRKKQAGTPEVESPGKFMIILGGFLGFTLTFGFTLFTGGDEVGRLAGKTHRTEIQETPVAVVQAYKRPRRTQVQDDVVFKGWERQSPEFGPDDAVIGSEKQVAVDVGKFDGRGRATGKDIRNYHGAVLRAIGLPQLESVNAIIGTEKQRTVDVGQ